MAFFIKNNENPQVLLTNGGYVELGDNLAIDDNNKLNVSGSLSIDIDSEFSTESENPVLNKVISKYIEDTELAVSAALNDLNSRLSELENLNLSDVASGQELNTLDIEDFDLIVSSALNDLNSRLIEVVERIEAIENIINN